MVFEAVASKLALISPISPAVTTTSSFPSGWNSSIPSPIETFNVSFMISLYKTREKDGRDRIHSKQYFPDAHHHESYFKNFLNKVTKT